MRAVLKLCLFLLLTFSFSTAKELLLASTYPVYYPLRYMAEGRFEIDLLVRTLADPHHYELKPEDMKRLQKAKAFFYLGVEGWEKRVAGRIPKEKARALREGLDFIKVGKHTDPHVWLSPKTYSRLVENLRDSLIKLDPAGVEQYRKRAEEFLTNLRALDQEYEKNLSNCQSRTLVISHLSVLYLGRDYGFEVVGLRGLHAEEEPRPSEIRKMVEKLRKEKVRTVFLEKGYEGSLARKLSEETGARVLSINTSLFPEEKQDDYFSIMRRNLKSLSEGLACQTK